ncbi:MAG: hypothetical protein WB791_01080 [Waddliaceae bacterium]
MCGFFQKTSYTRSTFLSYFFYLFLLTTVWLYTLGKVLIKWLEDLANQEGYDQIGIGVGLYRDYGPAQKLYFQLGYVPDGNGITYKDQPTVPGQAYPLDDDLILWLMKPLRIEKFHG